MGAALSALLAAAACGSTVQVHAAGDAATDGGLELGLGGPLPSNGAEPTNAAAERLGSTSAPDGGDVGTSGAATDGPPVSEGARPSAPTTLPSKRDPVDIGVVTSGDFGSSLKSLGINASAGDQRAQTRIILNYLNAHGGILGRPVRPVFYDYDTSATPQVNGQAACAAFTEDHHVVAAIGVAGMDDTYHACADKRGMFVLSDNDVKSSSFFRRFRTSIEISEMATDRKYRAMVLALKDMGFFGAGAKVGLLYTDERNDAEGVREGMKPALASIGITPLHEVALSSTDSSQYYSQMSSAVLKFRADGITHVLFGFAAAWVFAETADKQGYYPSMGLDSRQSPGAFMETVNSPRSLANVSGVGYLPIADVDADRDPGPVSARARLCAKLFSDAQQGFGTDRIAASGPLVLCDELFFLQDTFAGRADLSRASFLSGVAAHGSSYPSTLTFATRFSDTQHDGPQAYRPLRYTAGCRCFMYVGPTRPLR